MTSCIRSTEVEVCWPLKSCDDFVEGLKALVLVGFGSWGCMLEMKSHNLDLFCVWSGTTNGDAWPS